MLIIKTLLYTGVPVSELIKIKLNDIDFTQCQIRIPYSGHETRASLEIYSKLSLPDAQESYDDNIKDAQCEKFNENLCFLRSWQILSLKFL